MKQKRIIKKKKTKINNRLRQEVINLHNKLFIPQIEKDDKNVSAIVMTTICFCYMSGGTPFDVACTARSLVRKIKNENKRLIICKQLLQGEKVKIPGMLCEYYLLGIFYDMNGNKIVDDDENESELDNNLNSDI